MIKALVQALANLFRPVRTVDYPAEEKLPLPKDYRGLIEFDSEHCIYCDKCEKVCPPGAIVFKQNEDGTKAYNYNPWLCIYCGECVRSCPKSGDALWQSEAKPRCALKEEDVNGGWFVLQAEAKESREAYAAARKAKTAENPKG
jgi:formate hydrogenlyase subunit 6/NADH:ubiquinone oxidoreductase subunit I